jgi:GNAT superfamily N-acetyltransferase
MLSEQPVADRSSFWLDRLSASDIERGMELVTEVGWNQTPADWAMMLAAGDGRGIRTPDGRLIATSVAMRYPIHSGWISMVIVDPAHRGQGYARRLLEAAVQGLEEEGFVPALDATPAGRAVYARLGFEEFASITRWRGWGRGPKGRAPVGVGEVDQHARSRAAALAAGYDMREPLSRIAARGWTWSNPGKEAFAWARPGRAATHLGPVVSQTDASALALCEEALEQLSGPILVDVPDQQTALSQFLASRGFSRERGFHRMTKGQGTSAGLSDTLRATAGPELG